MIGDRRQRHRSVVISRGEQYIIDKLQLIIDMSMTYQLVLYFVDDVLYFVDDLLYVMMYCVDVVLNTFVDVVMKISDIDGLLCIYVDVVLCRCCIDANDLLHFIC